MANPSLAPGYIKFTYTGTLFPHHQTVPVKYDGIPSPGFMPSILPKNGLSQDADLGLAAHIGSFLTFFHTGTRFGLAEAHAVDATTGLDTFLFSWDVNLVGSGAAANIPTTEMVFTFKLSTGGLYRLYLMEGNEAANQKVFLPSGNTDIDAVNTFMTGTDSIVWGRTNAYPFAGVSLITKYNDKLRKQQGLS